MGKYTEQQPATDTDLFRAPFQKHSTTSIESAAKIDPDTNTLRAQVLECLREHGDAGLTDEQIQNALSMNPSTERPRRIELVRAGMVRDSGKTRATKSGRAAVIWIVTSQGAPCS